jgi:hypothetical protein
MRSFLARARATGDASASRSSAPPSFLELPGFYRSEESFANFSDVSLGPIHYTSPPMTSIMTRFSAVNGVQLPSALNPAGRMLEL